MSFFFSSNVSQSKIKIYNFVDFLFSIFLAENVKLSTTDIVKIYEDTALQSAGDGQGAVWYAQRALAGMTGICAYKP